MYKNLFHNGSGMRGGVDNQLFGVKINRISDYY